MRKQDTLIQSGATIGQIAKIAAVDDNGVPTAWEPTDFPDSGEISDCIKAPSAAEVGQTIVVKTIDNDGKPTEFEAERVADEMEALASLSECGILTPVYQYGTFYTDSYGSIYTL